MIFGLGLTVCIKLRYDNAGSIIGNGSYNVFLLAYLMLLWLKFSLLFVNTLSLENFEFLFFNFSSGGGLYFSITGVNVWSVSIVPIGVIWFCLKLYLKSFDFENIYNYGYTP